MSQPPPPAGWYPDPQGYGQRWWDGTGWTEQLAPAPAAVADPYRQSRQWAMAAHLSGLGGLLIGMNWLGPLVIYLIKKDEDAFVADQAREALNFNLSVFIYMVVLGIVTFVLFFILIGLLLIPVLFGIGVAWVVLCIVAGVRANKGEPYRYPLTMRMVS